MSTQPVPRTARRGAVLVAALVALLGLTLAACGGSGSGSSDPSSAAQAPPRTLTVSAAASLTEVYQSLGQQFQAANPGVTVKFNFGGSDQLAQQTEEAPAREAMEFDVVIVGAGPAGLAAAIRLKQLDENLSVVVLEKGSEVGAHICPGRLSTRSVSTV